MVAAVQSSRIHGHAAGMSSISSDSDVDFDEQVLDPDGATLCHLCEHRRLVGLSPSVRNACYWKCGSPKQKESVGLNPVNGVYGHYDDLPYCEEVNKGACPDYESRTVGTEGPVTDHYTEAMCVALIFFLLVILGWIIFSLGQLHS